MREILFRGKRYMDGEWADGSLFIDEKKEKHEILVGYVNYRVGWEVIPETVGQFTGLTDKNGKMIFEGDIVIHHNDNPFAKGKEKGHVFWDENSLRWRRTTNHVTHLGKVDSYVLSSSCIYEVIGNIYDNPELLKGDGR